MDEPTPTPYDPYYEQFVTNNPSPLDGLGVAAGLFAGGLLIYMIFTAGAIALGIWVWYTVTWRAIRRGLHEFHHNSCPPKLHKTKPNKAMYPPRNWR